MRSLCCRYGEVVGLIPSTEVIDEVSAVGMVRWSV